MFSTKFVISVTIVNLMPYPKMKSTQSTAIKGKGFHVCQKSNVISKKVHSDIRSSQQITDYDPHEFQLDDVFPITEMPNQIIEKYEAINTHHFQDGENFELQKQPSPSFDYAATLSMDSTDTCSSILNTIASPVSELSEVLNESNIYSDAGGNNDFYVPRFGANESNDNSVSFNYHTWSILDFCPLDTTVSSLPLEKDNTGMYPFSNDNCIELSAFFGLPEQCTILPHLENFGESNSSNPGSYQQIVSDPHDSGLYLAMEEMRFTMGESVIFDLDKAESFDLHPFFRTLPELSDVSNFQPSLSAKELQRRKSITLVLDLDETLVHSTMEQCEDADFTFTIFFNMKEHTIYVKKRPHLHTFLQRVAELFEVVIFTASQSIYAEEILNTLDPDGKFITRRAFRDSCIFSDGIYTKDLTVLGGDLAKIAIIDNSPQVFRFQVNNGIPIQSWFDDPSDSALISLLPFLETLAEAEDVRPLIAKKFGNKE